MGNYVEEMVFELEARGRDPKTIRGYLKTMDSFSKHFGKHPKNLGVPQIKQYMHYMLQEKKVCS